MECYTALKKHALLMYAKVEIDLGNIMLSEKLSPKRLAISRYPFIK